MPVRVVQSLLKGFFLQVSNISLFNSPLLPFHYNPESLKLTCAATVSTATTGGTTTQHYRGRELKKIAFDLLFDDLNTTPVPPTMYAINWLMNMCEATVLSGVASAWQQPVLICGFGEPNTSFKCHLKSVDITVSMFTPIGSPARAKCSVQLVETKAGFGPQNPTSGGTPGRQMHMMVAGDTLQSVATRFYKKPNYWRAIAIANGIDDPHRVPLGRTLAVPPISEAKAMI